MKPDLLTMATHGLDLLKRGYDYHNDHNEDISSISAGMVAQVTDPETANLIKCCAELLFDLGFRAGMKHQEQTVKLEAIFGPALQHGEGEDEA